MGLILLLVSVLAAMTMGCGDESTIEYRLVWADEFEGDAVDPEKWSFETGDGCPGLCGVDDDNDGSIDEGSADDDDEDGSTFDDPYDPVVYYLNGSSLLERMPAPRNTDGISTPDGPVELPLGVFGTGETEIEVTYDFALIEAGLNIDIEAFGGEPIDDLRGGLEAADLNVATDAGPRLVSVSDAMEPLAIASVSM